MIGTDIIEIERIRDAIDEHKEHFLNRIFTPREQEDCTKHKDPVPRYAGRFAAKEAVSKALGTGFGKNLSWLDIEITNDDLGRPLISLSEKARTHFKEPSLHISISHCKLYATATALVYKKIV